MTKIINRPAIFKSGSGNTSRRRVDENLRDMTFNDYIRIESNDPMIVMCIQPGFSSIYVVITPKGRTWVWDYEIEFTDEKKVP